MARYPNLQRGIRRRHRRESPARNPIPADERVRTRDVEAARNEAISYVAYRVLLHRYRESPGAKESLPSFDALLAAVGNRAALRVIEHGLADGADELGGVSAATPHPYGSRTARGCPPRSRRSAGCSTATRAIGAEAPRDQERGCAARFRIVIVFA